MRTNFNPIHENRKLLEQLQQRKQIKILLTYSKLIELKQSMYYTPDDGGYKGITILKEKYKYFDLSKIDEAINEAWEKVNKIDYFNICLDYIFKNTLSIP